MTAGMPIAGNRDGLGVLGYNGIDFSIRNGATVAMRIANDDSPTSKSIPTPIDSIRIPTMHFFVHVWLRHLERS